jgi:hypothetical protein
VFFNFFDASITPGPNPAITGGSLYNDIVDHAYPVPNYLGTSIHFQLDTNPARSSAIMLNCEGSSHGVQVPEVGNVNVYTAREYIDEVEAVLFFGNCGHDHLSSLDYGLAYGYGVLTEDYQGCVGFDRQTHGGGNPPGFFQSKEMCHATSLVNGVRAASGEIIGNQVHLTGEIASSAPMSSMIMQMWGPDVDIQQFFRVI